MLSQVYVCVYVHKGRVVCACRASFSLVGQGLGGFTIGSEWTLTLPFHRNSVVWYPPPPHTVLFGISRNRLQPWCWVDVMWHEIVLARGQQIFIWQIISFGWCHNSHFQTVDISLSQSGPCNDDEARVVRVMTVMAKLPNVEMYSKSEIDSTDNNPTNFVVTMNHKHTLGQKLTIF